MSDNTRALPAVAGLDLDALTALRKLLARAHGEVSDIAEGKRRWTMSIPAKPDTDSDLLIGTALHEAEKALSALTAARAERDDYRDGQLRALRDREAAERETDARLIEAWRERDATRAELEQTRAHLTAALPVLAYVSRGRGFVGVEPYPDATARRVLGAIDDAERAAPASGTNSGHCGLCGSEDCPGVPGKGCTPGPFEPVKPWPLIVSCPVCHVPERVWCIDGASGGRIGHVHDDRRAAAVAGTGQQDTDTAHGPSAHGRACCDQMPRQLLPIAWTPCGGVEACKLCREWAEEIHVAAVPAASDNATDGAA